MFQAKFTALRGMPAALGAVALVTLTAACGSAPSSSGPTVTDRAVTNKAVAAKAAGNGPVTVIPVSPASIGPAPAGAARLTAAAAAGLIARAVANTRAAASVRVIGQAVTAQPAGNEAVGQTVSFDMTLVKNAGCEGAMAVSKTAAVRVVQAAGYIWMLPNSSSYPELRLSKPALALIANKYIKVKSTASQAGDLPTACTFTGLLGALTKSPAAAVPVTYNGIRAYEVIESGKRGGTAFVSRAAKPLLLQLASARTAGGTITFTDYNATKAIIVPTAAESVDGSTLGV
jgi:hypothetical protein